MSLQIERSVEDSVTIRTTKSLKDCINFAHITYMIIVPQQSDSIVIFLQTSPSKFSDNVTIYNSNISTMLRASRSSAIGISFIWTLWNWLGLSPSILLMNKLNNFEVTSASRWVPCKWRASARKRYKLSLYGYLVFFSYVRQLIVWFLSSGSGKTAFLYPIGTSLGKAANTFEFVDL